MIGDSALAMVDVDAIVRDYRRQARRRQLIADVEDHVGDLHEWPHKEQQLALATRPVGRGSVFRFVLFLLGNRAPPRPVAALLIGLGLLPTSKKRRDAWDAMRGFRDGTLRIDAFYWSLEAGSGQNINAPGSWCAHGVPADMRDPTFWADAQRMLRCQ